VLKQFRPQVRAFGAWLVAFAKQSAIAVLLTAVAIVIASYFLVKRETVVKAALDIGARIAGDAGVESVRLAGQTIRTVAKGVVGVAAIQAGLAAVGLPGGANPGCRPVDPDHPRAGRRAAAASFWCSFRRSSISSPRMPGSSRSSFSPSGAWSCRSPTGC
jgi:hypothetical protein